MVDRHEELPAHLPRERDGAGRGCEDRRADGRRDVDAAMAGRRRVGRWFEPAMTGPVTGHTQVPAATPSPAWSATTEDNTMGTSQLSTDHGGDPSVSVRTPAVTDVTLETGS